MIVPQERIARIALSEQGRLAWDEAEVDLPTYAWHEAVLAERGRAQGLALDAAPSIIEEEHGCLFRGERCTLRALFISHSTLERRDDEHRHRIAQDHEIRRRNQAAAQMR
jgi:hypothetical protein